MTSNPYAYNGYYRPPPLPPHAYPQYPAPSAYPPSFSYGTGASMMPGVPGPGPATMQNGYGGYGDYGGGYGGYRGYADFSNAPGVYQRQGGVEEVSSEVGGEQVVMASPLATSGGVQGRPQGVPGMMLSPSFQYPPNHPYAFGGGVGYSYRPPHMGPYGYGGYAEYGRGGIHVGGGKLNPTAQGFKYNRGRPNFQATGHGQMPNSQPSFPTLANQDTASQQRLEFPNGHVPSPALHAGATVVQDTDHGVAAMVKPKLVLPVVANPSQPVQSPSIPGEIGEDVPAIAEKAAKDDDASIVSGGVRALTFITADTLSTFTAPEGTRGKIVLVDGRPNNEIKSNTYALSLQANIPDDIVLEFDQTKRSEHGKKCRRQEEGRGKRVIWSNGKNKRDSLRLVFGSVEPKDDNSRLEERVAEVKTDEEKIATDLPLKTAEEKAPVEDSIVSTPSPAPTTASAPPISQPSSTPAPPPKPKSWAALLRPSSTPSSTTSKLSVSTPEKASGVENESEAGPSTTCSTPSGSKPVFNYAAAANSALPNPQLELVKLLSEGAHAIRNAQRTELTGKIGKGKMVEKSCVPRGLINTGNMCFANTILQVLVYCSPFTELFEELGKRLKADLAKKTPLLEAMIVFLQKFVISSGQQQIQQAESSAHTNGQQGQEGKAKLEPKREPEAFIPENVYDAMKENKRFDSMRRGHQEDAEEYLGFFLNTLHEEILYLLSCVQLSKRPSLATASSNPDANRRIEHPISPDAVGGDADGWLEVGKKQKIHVVRMAETRESAISRLFGGRLRSILHTPGQKDSVTIEPYQPLQLDIQHSSVLSISDALLALSQPEIIPGVWSASKGTNVDATKTVYLETVPKVLICHLKRFVYDAQEGGVVKRGKGVSYAVDLIIPLEIISPSHRTPTPIKYVLFGVVYHHGSSASGGHYTVAVAKPLRSSSPSSLPNKSDTSVNGSGGWLHFDDENVKEVQEKEVIVGKDEARDGKVGLIGGREKCAYLLFYKRMQ
nr:hypothetical protein L203_03368 [Cryptococcus depauperatus CBS 7841]